MDNHTADSWHDGEMASTHKNTRTAKKIQKKPQGKLPEKPKRLDKCRYTGWVASNKYNARLTYGKKAAYQK